MLKQTKWTPIIWFDCIVNEHTRSEDWVNVTNCLQYCRLNTWWQMWASFRFPTHPIPICQMYYYYSMIPLIMCPNTSRCKAFHICSDISFSLCGVCHVCFLHHTVLNMFICSWLQHRCKLSISIFIFSQWERVRTGYSRTQSLVNFLLCATDRSLRFPWD